MMPGIVGLTPKDPQAGKALSVNEADLLRPCLDFFHVMILHDAPVKRLDVRNFIPRAYVLDTLYIEGNLKDIESNVDELKRVIADLLSKGIERGKVTVSGTGTCTFVPEDPAALPREQDAGDKGDTSDELPEDAQEEQAEEA